MDLKAVIERQIDILETLNAVLAAQSKPEVLTGEIRENALAIVKLTEALR